MMTAKEIKCNFTKVFALFNSVEEITDLANNICAQVKEAFEARKNEIQSDEWIGIEDVIEIVNEVKAGEAKEQKHEEPPRIDKAASKTERAKEMAAKFKKDKSEAKTEPKKEVKAKKETKVETKKETKTQSTSDDLIAITDTAAIKKLGLTFEKYNDKCYVLRGNTKPLRKVLQSEFRGVYNGRLTGGEGWVIANKHAQNCAKALGLKLAV